MKKVISLLFILLVSEMLFACSLNLSGEIYAGTTIADGTEWPGCVSISIDSKVSDLDDEVVLHYSYGHAYSNDAVKESIISHYFVIYIVDGNNFSVNPSDGIILTETTIEGDQLLSDDYLCDPGDSIFSRVSYNNSFDLSVDFSEYDFDYGVIIVRFYETKMGTEDIDGELVASEMTSDNFTIIYFRINDSSVEFSRTSFS